MDPATISMGLELITSAAQVIQNLTAGNITPAQAQADLVAACDRVKAAADAFVAAKIPS